MAIGGESFNNFDEDSGSAGTFDFGDIDAGTERVTITTHGFGANGTLLHLKYTEGTAAIPGFTDGAIEQWEIIDANTVECQSDTITSAGTGTGHTLTPRYVYDNSVALGYDAEPDAGNQIMLGDTNVTQIKSTGNLYISGTGNENYINNNTGIGLTDPDTKLDVDGAITARELSADPSDPDEGSWVIWMSDGTGSGDDGDIMVKITAGASTKTITLIDFSAF